MIDGNRRPAPAPPFQRIAIVGVGAVGGSLAKALRETWPESLVIGVDAHGVIEDAIRMQAIDVGSDDLTIAAEADLVVLAGSSDENARVLPFLADAIGGEAVVLCLGEAAAMHGDARALPARLPFLTALPAVELRRRGVLAADAALLRGRRWTVTPMTAVAEAVDRVHTLIRALGGEPVAGAVH